MFIQVRDLVEVSGGDMGGGSEAAGRACLGLSRLLTKLLHNINRIV